MIASASVFSQTKNQFVRSADEAFEDKNYYAAVSYYQEAIARDKDDDLSLRYKLAESSREYMSYSLAEQTYKYVIEQDTSGIYPLATFYLAEMQQMQGGKKYEEARENYNLYLTMNNGDDAYYTFKADKERKACEWAYSEYENADESIKINKIESNINTNYSDFAPFIKDNDLYYSSMRFEPKSKNNDGTKVAKVLKAEIPEDYETTFGSGELIEGVLNSNMGHTANTAFNTDKSKIFYTVCERINGSEIRCDLYCRMVDEDGNFGDGKKLPDFINDSTYTSTQPTIGYDASIDKEILYFTSDREGGKGKMDIWYSVIDNKDNFTRPQNLEAINTKEDELTPFYHLKSNTLYFSSDGYRSWGGYDVYSSTVKNGEYGQPIHMNNPLNSSYHDLYFVMAEDGNTGYLATNRESAQYIDDVLQACCFDIHKVKFEPLDLSLNALTYDKISQLDLAGATVRLINEDTGDLVGEITNDSGNDHKFMLDRCTNYIIIAEKLGYKPDTIKYSTCGLKKSQEIIKKLYLQPDLLELDVFTFDDNTKANLDGCTVTLTNLSDPNVEPLIIPNMTSNDWNFKLIRGQKYTVKAEKIGYYPASVDIITENIAGTKIVKKLYLRQDFVASLPLPLRLYFDNDKPDPKTTRRQTTKTYTETYNKYLLRRPTFERKSADPALISSFFDQSVTNGYVDFQNFLKDVKPLLESGQSFEITIKGFASPLSQTNYNLYLGQRRISSIMNEIRSSGLGKYLDSGQLKVTDISYGETLSPKDVSDSRQNTRASIYSVEASRERRVEIIDVTRQQN